MGDISTYWSPVNHELSSSCKFDELRKRGQLFELKREAGPIRRFLFGELSCDIQVGYNNQDRNLVMLVASSGIDHSYLTAENTELEELRKRKGTLIKKTDIIDVMSGLKKKLIERLNYRGLTPNDLRFAKTYKMGFDERQQLIFQRAIDEIIDKYFLEPD